MIVAIIVGSLVGIILIVAATIVLVITIKKKCLQDDEPNNGNSLQYLINTTNCLTLYRKLKCSFYIFSPHRYHSESYSDEHQYDYANFEEDDRVKRVRVNQEAHMQRNVQERVLGGVENPSYVAEEMGMQANPHIQNVTVIKNPSRISLTE